jgi:ribosomal protein S18 acetylase RimI-like enzyme
VTAATPARLRPATAGDRDFLRDVYGSTRAGELALVPWDAATKRAFVEHQFTAQDTHYRHHYPDASFDVIEVDGQPAGRLCVHRRPQELRIVDIALLPAFRGRGVGSALIRALLDEARESRRAVSIHVERNNRARSLYDRLGFLPVGDEGVYLLMEWTPTADAQAKIAS